VDKVAIQALIDNLTKQLNDVQEVAEVTISSWSTDYLSILHDRNYNPQTIKNRRANLKHVVRLWGSHTLKSLKPYQITQAVKPMLPGKASTVRRVISELRDMYSEAIANGIVDVNPVLHVKLPAYKVTRRRLTIETWYAMIEYASAHPQRWVRCMLLLALITGQRRSDLAKMQESDVRDGYLHVEQQKQAGKGYGARVAIPLALVLPSIGMSLAEVLEECWASANAGSTMLRKRNGKPIEVSSLSARFNECLRAVEEYEQYLSPSLHEVRALAAREFDKAGINVQILLGHKHAVMTDLYKDDRGLTAHVFKQVALPMHTNGA